MDLNRSILSDIVIHNKYARWLPKESRRETYEEIVDRNKEMHLKRFPHLAESIEFYYQAVYQKLVMPSMRSMQFAGKPIELSPNRMFNCCFMHIDDYRAFSETMFLLLGGTGVGYSVQTHHVEQLPCIRKPIKTKRYVVPDSVEGWADSVKLLMKAYLMGAPKPRYDFSDIRPKGARLITAGGKAPGPEPLKICLIKIEGILESKQDGEKLTTLECHDIQCHIADAVLAGGIRRSAMISLFDIDDFDMLTCKTGNWFELNPQRGRANNSAVGVRSKLDRRTFDTFFDYVQNSGTGEPGLCLTNNPEWGTNPCAEASLRANQGCNLAEINAALIFDQETLDFAATAAGFIGTLQASYTDFHYLRPIWKTVFERDALLGVGITGLASETFLALDLTQAAKSVLDINAKTAAAIGIRPSARSTLIKPSGTTALALGTASGIHDWHSKFYLRRMKLLKNEAMYYYLMSKFPQLIEDDVEKPHIQAVLTIPIKAPEGAITRHDASPVDLLERVADVYQRWVLPGHRKGDNTHSISCTVNVKDNEWATVREWMWENQDSYNCISVFPHYGGTHKQLPFEDCDEETYNRLSSYLTQIDLSEIIETDDETDLAGEAACAGGACEVVFN